MERQPFHKLIDAVEESLKRFRKSAEGAVSHAAT